MITAPPKKFIKNPLFISFTSIKDFLKCPNSYYLKNIYRDPKTGNRIQIASSYLSLGSTVHDATKWFLQMQGQVTKVQLEDKFRNLWLKYRGKNGGFESTEQEGDFGRRGLKMLENFFNNAKVLEPSAPDISFPKMSLFEDVILMGNFDFVGEVDDGSLHVVDFKTGAKDEQDSLQLYIYAILAEANFGKSVSAASFWYLDREDVPRQIVLDELEPKLLWITEKAKQLKEVKEKGQWICIRGAKCNDCNSYQAIIDGKGQFQFTDDRYHKDVYYLNTRVI
ncbi:MAG: Uncharacterized protein G01um10147_472 [Microgenomates group bacterium Gr01-1014_7]|nr:MAG: Uncharacterized protein G01um10147_472 [Microgenomates group bacterium Gr01-1014_7]